MEVRRDDFPIVIQAYEMVDGKEIFIAEQVVNNQGDVNTFTGRYAGKLIKAKQHAASGGTSTLPSHKKSSAGTVVLIIIFILIVLVAIAYYTGWLQRTFGIGAVVPLPAFTFHEL